MTEPDAVAPDLLRLLNEGALPPPRYGAAEITSETVHVTVRDGIRLATDVYLPPDLPAPAIVVRTPVGRDLEAWGYAASLLAVARRGYVVISQDCRGTGDSEPDSWDYFVHEPEDGVDLVDWITKQDWYDGFIGSAGGSYLGVTQWQMATHPAMSATAPTVSGLGFAINTAHLYMFLDSYARVVGKGEDKIAVPITEMERVFHEQTMAGGYFNEPLHLPFSEVVVSRFPALREMAPTAAKRWLWERYCEMSCAERAGFVKQALGVTSITITDMESLPAIFGHRVSHAALAAVPKANAREVCQALHAPPLLRTGWYDWGVNDALATFEGLRRLAEPHVAERARLIITPWAHNMPGYLEGGETNPELLRQNPDVAAQTGALLRWYEAVREGTTDSFPRVIYYLMGANEWRSADDWPVPGTAERAYYLGAGGTLSLTPPHAAGPPDRYVYDPDNPTPTVGGSIVSFLYRPGSVDVSEVQRRGDVLTYTTELLDDDLDVVGPLRLTLHASSSAVDTDWVARLSDVFPDGRALQLQSGILRARHRDLEGEPELLEPGRIYAFEIDMWATANRFKAGHRLRVDISSADFPHYDRNSNRGGERGDPIPAQQAIYHDAEHPSRFMLSVLR